MKWNLSASLVMAVGAILAVPVQAQEKDTDSAPAAIADDAASAGEMDTQETQRSLYERLGGLRGITELVDDFHNRLEADPIVNTNPAIAPGLHHAPSAYLKFEISQLLCSLTGGPCVYDGPKLKEAHSHLRITSFEWAAMRGDLKKALDSLRIPIADQLDLFDLFGQLRADIVSNAHAVASAKPQGNQPGWHRVFQSPPRADLDEAVRPERDSFRRLQLEAPSP